MVGDGRAKHGGVASCAGVELHDEPRRARRRSDESGEKSAGNVLARFDAGVEQEDESAANESSVQDASERISSKRRGGFW
ncbi:hypothetical protein [Burkholderia thailandensis]|uniref:hypothetical protein n=1 Tax=Burkholderia thailandensis TaxID=57975 RepID=UPI00217DA425|nr:hypothetical protein [Burkholderia thailandensis]MCS6520948.1 hypothetical protein [Burkholderia thailandensis]